MDEHMITYLQYFTGTDGHQRAVYRIGDEWVLDRQIAIPKTFWEWLSTPWEQQAIEGEKHG